MDPEASLYQQLKDERQRQREKLKGLKVGASFSLNGTSESLRQHWYWIAKTLKIKIAIRTTPEGTRLWRLT